MGLGPKTIRTGDSVAVVSGMALPVVMIAENESYRLLGPANIQGIVDGQLWPGNEAELEGLLIVWEDKIRHHN